MLADGIRKSTTSSGNTRPGADGILVEQLTACWDLIGRYITHLFRGWLRIGYIPNCFKLAEIIFIPKANYDFSSIKGWRPIDLLSCIVKGLEIIIAKRKS